jgi:hypothetical protein
MNIKYSGVSEFLGFLLIKYLSAAPIINEHQETRVLRVIASNIHCHGLMYPVGQRTSDVRSTGDWASM